MQRFSANRNHVVRKEIRSIPASLYTMKMLHNSLATISALAAILKANLSGWYLLLAMLFFSIVFAG